MKTPRNEPCPCGSGKKYKKCCLVQDESMVAEKRSEQAEAHRRWREDMEQVDLRIEELIDLSNKANDLIRAEQWSEAEVACRQLQEQFPDEIDGDHRFYEYYKARGDFREAKKHAQATLAMVESHEGFDPQFPEEIKEDIAAFDERIQADHRTD